MDANGNSEAGIGYGSETWLSKPDGTLFELDEVTEVLLPEESTDDVETTHMKSPGKRKQYKPGLIEPGDAKLTVNYVPGSPTDLLLREMQSTRRIGKFKTTIPDDEGIPTWKIEGFLYVKSRSRAVTVGAVKTMTVNVRITGAVDEAVAVA